MICFNPKCFTAMNEEIRGRASWVSSHWQERDGDIEGWICPECGSRMVTEMIGGVRKAAGLLMVRDEEEA
jgi:hypothetical protein